MKVAIVVLIWNSKAYMDVCLASLQRLDKKDVEVEIVVVDNASQDGSVAHIQKKYPKFTVLENTENLGYAGGNNAGIRHALAQNADYVWIVNPDVRVDKHALQKLVAQSESRPRAGILGSKIYFEKGFEYHPDRYRVSQLGRVIWFAGGDIDWDNVITRHVGVNEVDIGQYNGSRQTEFITGASLLIRNEVLRSVGSLDEKYFLYYEETDLCVRALRAGWELVYVGESVAWHANAQATGVGSGLVDYYTTRNRLLFGIRYAPARTKLALIRESLRMLFSGRSTQRQGVLDFYLGNFGRGSYDIRHHNN